VSKTVRIIPVLFALVCAASAQFGLPSAQQNEPSQSDTSTQQRMTPSVTSPLQESPFMSSVATGKVSAEPVKLTILAAIDLGLKNNLGAILSAQGGAAARAARLNSLSRLLPNVNAKTTESLQQINLAAFGFPVQPGQPTVIGPFSVFDARATASQRIIDLKAMNQLRTSNEELRAAKLSYADARELVTLVVANGYLEALAGQARVEAAQAQLDTATTLFNQTSDLKKNGVAAGIDVLRTQVQMQARQQRLIFLKNEAEKQKLALVRTIGLPTGQRIVLADKMPEAPMPPITLDIAIDRAREQRSDLLRAKSLVKAAESNKRAQESQYLPSLRFDGDYGTLGRTPGNSHGTFTAAATLSMPIFTGGKIRSDVQQADVELQSRKAELADTEGRVEAEVRRAFMDVESATAQVTVAKSALDLAHQQLTQARDRFAAGVAGSLDVVESEQAVTEADENLISALYSSNIAKATLARATGRAEQLVKDFLGAK
jgi:outer membrane protein TolC